MLMGRLMNGQCTLLNVVETIVILHPIVVGLINEQVVFHRPFLESWVGPYSTLT